MKKGPVPKGRPEWMRDSKMYRENVGGRFGFREPRGFSLGRAMRGV